MSELSAKQEGRLHRALVDAFVDVPAFGRVMEYGVGKRVQEISGNTGLETVVQEAMTWCRTRDRLMDLLISAREYNPENGLLRRVAEEIGMLPAAPAVGAPERIILKNAGFQDVAPWRERMSRAELAVCRVEIDGEGVGTGFLVGPSAVITNHHVLEELIDGTVQSSAVSCRFDHRHLPDGRRVSKGVTFALDDHAVVSWSGMDELDYALVRLADEPGESPLGGRVGAPARGWLKPVRWKAPSTPEPVIVLQHADGRPLQVSFGAVLTDQHEDGKVFYNANTEPGSSGSPCFTVDWSLVALHHWGAPTWNRGVLFSTILDRLKAEGVEEALDE